MTSFHEVLDPAASYKKLRRRIPDYILHSLGAGDLIDVQRRPLQQAFAEAVIDMAFSHPELLQEAQDAIREDRHIDSKKLNILRALYPSRIEYINSRSRELLPNTIDKSL